MIYDKIDGTGTFYRRNRSVDPMTGRFTQEDPIGLAGGLNVYGYAGNNPLSYSDPYGLCPVCALLVNAGLGAFIAGSVQAFSNIANGREPMEHVGRAMLAGAGVGAVGYAFGAALGASEGTASAEAEAAQSGSPDFVVTSEGTAIPVPEGATGPSPVVNRAGRTTGSAYTGGRGGTNGQVSTVRIMNPTPARGRSPGYPNGYVKYENSNGQPVNPATGQTVPQDQAHHPLP